MKHTDEGQARLDRLAEHYDTTDTTDELQASTAAGESPSSPTAEPMTTFAVRLPVPLLERTREIAGQEELTTSALIRRWIEAGLADASSQDSERVVPVHALLELIGRAPHRTVPTTTADQGR